ncbi:MAG TPA: molybdate ABC transporter substrate-binding protein [Desulfuromonadaceae bacterium]
MRRITAIVIPLLVLLIPAVSALAGEITLSVAASLREVTDELAKNYGTTHPGVTFRMNYGGSGALAKQIENGAPADIFISANTEWMEYLKARKLTDNRSIAILAHNELVFVAKPAVKASAMGDIVRLNRIAIGSPGSVPAGEYAAEALRRAGIDKQVAKKLIMARDVRECLMYAEGGMVDGAFVYKTDALQLAKRAVIHFTVPQGLYPRVTYPMALTRAGAGKPEAAAFFAYLQSSAARAVLTRYGFPAR